MNKSKLLIYSFLFSLKINNLSILYGEPGGIRTPDPWLRRPMLYPTELLTHVGKILRFFRFFFRFFLVNSQNLDISEVHRC